MLKDFIVPKIKTSRLLKKLFATTILLLLYRYLYSERGDHTEYENGITRKSMLARKLAIKIQYLKTNRLVSTEG